MIPTFYAEKASVKNLTVTNKGTVTLYAQWAQNDITIDEIPVQIYTEEEIKPTLTVKSGRRLLSLR